jgi:hypothetical protein
MSDFSRENYSYNEFLVDFAILYEKHLVSTVPTKTERMGQYFMNLLEQRRPDIANQVRGTEDDPFYSEWVTEEQHSKVQELW